MWFCPQLYEGVDTRNVGHRAASLDQVMVVMVPVSNLILLQLPNHHHLQMLILLPKDEQISVLNKKIGELQRHVHKRDTMIRGLAKTVKRMEQTLKHHGFDLNSLEEISSSDID